MKWKTYKKEVFNAWRDSIFQKIYLLSSRLERSAPLTIDRAGLIKTLLPAEYFLPSKKWSTVFTNLILCVAPGNTSTKVLIQLTDEKEMWFLSETEILCNHDIPFALDANNPYRAELLAWHELAMSVKSEMDLINSTVHRYVNGVCFDKETAFRYWPELETFYIENTNLKTCKPPRKKLVKERVRVRRLNRKVYEAEIKPHQENVNRLLSKAIILPDIEVDAWLED